MAYIFEKHNFKDYLHRNCHRDWFTKVLNNTYETEKDETHIVSSYKDEWVVVAENRLIDPGIARAGDQHAANFSAYTAIGSGYVTGVSLLLAIPTGGVSLIPAAVGAANTALQTAVHVDASKELLRPEDVYFRLWVDKSEWVAKDISPWYANGGRKISDVAFDISCWSNQVYEERYVHQIQAHVQQRPPTPY